jgi:hypothetical protein
MKDADIDGILRAAAGHGDVDPQLVDRIAKTIGDSALPVRPLPRRAVAACGLLLVCGVLAMGGATRLGIYGLPRLSAIQIVAIFSSLCGLMWLAAMVLVDQMTPGSRRRVAPGWVVAGGSMALAALFAAVFHNYRTVRFVPAGLACLKAGVALAIPAALASWLVVRRGFFVSPVAAGMVAGALGGLAGIVMLEIHCPNFQTLHVMVWHTAVLPVSSAAGAAAGWAVRLRRR